MYIIYTCIYNTLTSKTPCEGAEYTRMKVLEKFTEYRRANIIQTVEKSEARRTDL